MTQDVWKVLEHTNDWLRFADTKAVGALAAAGVLGGLAANALLGDTGNVSGAALGFVIAGLLALMVAAGLAVFVIVPRLSVGEPNSLIYYEHVARKYKNNPDAHRDALNALLADDDALKDELAHQVWANATVARQKYLYSSWSLLALTIALILLAVGAGVATFT